MYAGTNAHSQNGISERDICMVADMARTMLLFARELWPNRGISNAHWPFSIQYATDLLNHLPGDCGYFRWKFLVSSEDPDIS